MKKMIMSMALAVVGITAIKTTTHNNRAVANEPAKLASINANPITLATMNIKKAIVSTPNTFKGYLGFYKGVLTGLGAKVTTEKIKFLEAWRRGEGGSATNNPFNTTKDVPGNSDTKYNSVGVRNYPDPQTGLNATVATLKLPYYKDIVKLLKKDDVKARDLARCRALKKWGTGDMVKKVLASSSKNLHTEVVAAL